jgi:hypothetical protein
MTQISATKTKATKMKKNANAQKEKKTAKRLDATKALRLTKSYRNPTEMNGILKGIEMIAKCGFANCSFVFPRTRAGASKAISARDSLQDLGFRVFIDKDNFRELILEVEWHEKTN